MNKHDIGGVIKNPVTLNFTKKNETPVLNLLVQTIDKHHKKDSQPSVIKSTHCVKIWGNLAKIVANNYSQGDYIMVSGRPETKPNKSKDGFTTEIIVNNVENISRSIKIEE